MDLRHGRGGERLLVELAADVLDRTSPLAFHLRTDLRERDRWHLGLQSGELLDEFSGDHVRPRRDELSQLDEGDTGRRERLRGRLRDLTSSTLAGWGCGDAGSGADRSG